MKEPKIGVVENVNIVEDESGAVKEVRVDVSHSPSLSSNNILFKMPSPRIWSVPEVGDAVEVSIMKGGQKVARQPLNLNEASERPSGIKEGDVAIRAGEAEIIIDKSTGDVTINVTDGNITLGDSTEGVPTLAHDHEVTLSDGTTTTTGSAQNGETNTNIE